MGSATEEFRKIVEARGAALRQLPFTELVNLTVPLEAVTIDGREGRISVIVEPTSSVGVRIIVQGFLDGRWFARFQTVALDGFDKNVSEVVSELEPSVFWGYD